ncbi:hypothetical protein SBD_4497 [Streptomyces bottropensis ATCC 25435]|uniref:Uncharacterized protein n=1 Tax=Streptomyces bottropensis ATCC 25435 TaxID=1054862 RepID=M3F031_9ACTN|nr:hypothetical protein SBD_4497 [Streptomyces bottropensis ATCC 25435]
MRSASTSVRVKPDICGVPRHGSVTGKRRGWMSTRSPRYR